MCFLRFRLVPDALDAFLFQFLPRPSVLARRVAVFHFCCGAPLLDEMFSRFAVGLFLVIFSPFAN